MHAQNLARFEEQTKEFSRKRRLEMKFSTSLKKSAKQLKYKRNDKSTRKEDPLFESPRIKVRICRTSWHNSETSLVKDVPLRNLYLLASYPPRSPRKSTMLLYLATLLLVGFTTVCAKPAPEPPSNSYFPPSSGGSLSGNYGPPSVPDTYGPPQQPPVVHKHVYVHVPPPEAPEYKPPKYIPPAAPPQKHYKIVFIKAPTPPTPTAPALPPLSPQDEEKTLIYVLVKKPEEAPDVVLPTQAPTQPSKPEVYFIRYKTQKESHNAEYGPPPQSPPSDNYGAPPSSSGGPY
ncbi:hypothetical protein ANTRET_LOCUS9732 [Anthophora retusa]